MSKLMCKDTHAAILRLDGVIADPIVTPANLHAAKFVEGGTGQSNIGKECIPAVAPDGIRALCTTTSFLTFTGMDRLEVINVAIRLIKVAIAVIIIAIPHIELCQIG